MNENEKWRVHGLYKEKMGYLDIMMLHREVAAFSGD